MQGKKTATRCRECGCHERNACLLVTKRGAGLRGCSWVEPDLCSGCKPPAGFKRLRGPVQEGKHAG